MSTSPRLLRAVPREPSEPPSDGELVGRALRGDARAEEAIFLRHAPGVTQMVERLLRNVEDSEDVVQHTFEVALRRLEKLERPAALRSWLLSIAVRRCHRVFRRRKLLHALGIQSHPDPETLVDYLAPDASAEARAELALLDVALTRVSEKERVVWMLHRVEGLTQAASAEVAGCSLATLKRRLAVADGAVRAHLEPDGDA